MDKEVLCKIETQCCYLIQEFLDHKVSISNFCSDLTTFWMNYRDTQESLKESWDQPYDKILIEARLRGEVTAEECSKLYSELWELDDMSEFSTMIDRVHSACSAFSPLPKYDWQIDEQQFRSEVQSLFTNYQKISH